MVILQHVVEWNYWQYHQLLFKTAYTLPKPSAHLQSRLKDMPWHCLPQSGIPQPMQQEHQVTNVIPAVEPVPWHQLLNNLNNLRKITSLGVVPHPTPDPSGRMDSDQQYHAQLRHDTGMGKPMIMHHGYAQV
jgi:hypothetical protein